MDISKGLHCFLLDSAEFAGQGAIITLDLGESGLKLETGEVKPFFLIVPARNYPKGFEITFVTATGDRISKVAGATMGKELLGGVLYTVGDIHNGEGVPGVKSTLKSNATVMSGRVYAPEITAIVHKDLNPATGNWLLFDHYTSDMPYGALLRIKSCTQLDPDHFEVVAVSDPNVAAPFKELVAGTPLYDERGDEILDIGYGSSDYPYNVFVVHWPNRSNGRPYENDL